MLSFEWPWTILLLPLPLLVYFLVPASRHREAALLVPFFRQLPAADELGSRGARQHWSRLLLLGIIWLCLLVACARPQWYGEPINLPASGRDLLLAVDISGSMETADMVWKGEQFKRITAVKAVVGEFVERRRSDRLGLILFGTQAYLQAPLTFDRATVKQLLQEAQLGFAGEKTAIGDAIGLSVKRLQSRPESSRVLILLTDGANTAGQVPPLKAAEIAAQADVKIYTVGVGADAMEMPGIFGSFGSRRINPSADLDEETLTQIATMTGGAYFRARNPDDLQAVYAELDKLEPVEQEAETFRPTRALFFWPLGVAVLVAGLLFCARLATTLRSRIGGDGKTNEEVGDHA